MLHIRRVLKRSEENLNRACLSGEDELIGRLFFERGLFGFRFEQIVPHRLDMGMNLGYIRISATLPSGMVSRVLTDMLLTETSSNIDENEYLIMCFKQCRPAIFKAKATDNSKSHQNLPTTENEEDVTSDYENNLPPLEENFNRTRPVELYSDPDSGSDSDRGT